MAKYLLILLLFASCTVNRTYYVSVQPKTNTGYIPHCDNPNCLVSTIRINDDDDEWNYGKGIESFEITDTTFTLYR